MSTKHYELTGETIGPSSAPLHRIRATRDIPVHGVRKGDVGGWIGHKVTLRDDAWVSGNAQVAGYALISGQSWVYGNARVSGSAEVSDDAWVSGEAKIRDDARVYGTARVSAGVWIGGKADVSDPQHLLAVGTIGSESRTAAAYPNRDGTHTLSVGCWKGTVDGLADEVEERSEDWYGTKEDHERWRAEYAALEALVRARITAWNKETPND